MEPAGTGRNHVRIGLIVAVIALLAVAAVYVFLRYGRTGATSLLQPETVLGAPLTVAAGTTTPSWLQQDDYTFIHQETAIPRDRVSQVRALMHSQYVPIPDKYGLFVHASDDTSWPPGNDYIHYYEDGIIRGGAFTGYHRIIAEYPSDGPTPPLYFWFATKDYRTYVARSTVRDSVPNPGFVDTMKVAIAADFPIASPDAQPVSKEFSLARGFTLYNGNLSTSTPQGAQQLTSVVPGTRLFAQPAFLSRYASEQNADGTTGTDPYATFVGEAQSYIGDTTQLVQCDESGVCFGYNLSFASFASSTVMRPMTDASNGGPYDALEIAPGTQDPKLYASYGNLFPAGCSNLDASWSYTVKNIQDTDVVDTGRSWLGVELYTFAHPESHPLVKAAYAFKKVTVLEGDSPNGTVPDFATYIQKDPILLFKDPWGRWVAVGEHMYMPPGGCGKPVVYLYPTEAEPVSVQFQKPPAFTADIPTYRDGWKVLAHPDGTLTDLQSSVTDCSGIDADTKGSEYAHKACAANAYPYLYWAGHADGTYPTPEGGWVVRGDELDTFLQKELESIGLSARESADMRSFWVPELEKAAVPYYRLSFFTTQQMNAFIPMRVVPRPQSVLRVFLDWSPLTVKPANAPTPQRFAPFARNGFTLVEWGGLERW